MQMEIKFRCQLFKLKEKILVLSVSDLVFIPIFLFAVWQQTQSQWRKRKMWKNLKSVSCVFFSLHLSLSHSRNCHHQPCRGDFLRFVCFPSSCRTIQQSAVCIVVNAEAKAKHTHKNTATCFKLNRNKFTENQENVREQTDCRIAKVHI